ncbi:MAG: hypothetical protein K2G63_03585 [Oscillospiraceae bacterium]|nr:hypothetical protein [Oscillospiraceae bacterium]
MSTKFKLITVILMCTISLTGCTHKWDVSSESSEFPVITTIKKTSTEPLPDFVLNTDNILFTADYTALYGAIEPYSHCIMCIRTDGQVYSVICPAEKATGNFFRNLYECDNIVWDIAEDIAHIGNISDDELANLIEYTENVNLQSEKNPKYPPDIMPDVESTSSHTFYSYKWDSDGKRKSFHINSQDDACISFMTLDENALKALELVKNTTAYKDWTIISRDKLFPSYLECTVLESHEKHALVKPFEDNITDEIVIPLCDENPEISAGNVIRIKYDGDILETYPAQINNIYEIQIIKRTE